VVKLTEKTIGRIGNGYRLDDGGFLKEGDNVIVDFVDYWRNISPWEYAYLFYLLKPPQWERYKKTSNI
jgi:hypothetical protein